MQKNFIETTIKYILMEKKTKTPLIVLQNKTGDRLLPLIIGPSEASSIIIEMEGYQPLRPLTHDVLVQFLNRHKFTIRALVLYANQQEKYYATLKYKKNLHFYNMELRPSDGIAIAVRLKKPIYCIEDILLDVTSSAIWKSVMDEKHYILYFHKDKKKEELM